MFSCEICEIFKNTYFDKHLRTAASGKTQIDNHLQPLPAEVRDALTYHFVNALFCRSRTAMITMISDYNDFFLGAVHMDVSWPG